MNRNQLAFGGWLLSVLMLFGLCYRDYVIKVKSLLPPEILESSCRNVYGRLFGKAKIEIRIVFGYKDSRPARFVGDSYERNGFVEALQAPCRIDRFDCGFERAGEDSDLFVKTIIGLDGKQHNINLRLVSSAVGPDDDDNRLNPFQQWKSKYAEELFYNGISSADVVFYNGHSRDGGGPDFEPPRLLKNQHVNYAWYIRQKRGPRMIEKSLQKQNRAAQLIGLYSCVSEKLIPKTRIRKNVGWIANKRLIYYADALQSLSEALSSLLGMKCESEFRYGTKETGSSLSQFF